MDFEEKAYEEIKKVNLKMDELSRQITMLPINKGDKRSRLISLLGERGKVTVSELMTELKCSRPYALDMMKAIADNKNIVLSKGTYLEGSFVAQKKNLPPVELAYISIQNNKSDLVDLEETRLEYNLDAENANKLRVKLAMAGNYAVMSDKTKMRRRKR